MRRHQVLSLLLVLCMAAALLAVPAGAADVTEVHSASEMMQALADTPAQAMETRGAPAEPTRILVLESALPDACGAQRVLHYAAYQEYVLEFAARGDAERAYGTLTETYGLRSCWLDTPEQGAVVMDEGASAMEASTWGANYMHLTAYRNDDYTLRHFNAALPIVAILDSGVDPENRTLLARSYMSYDFVNQTAEFSEVSGDNNARGHGTRIASILDSILPSGVRFMYLRVFDDKGSAARTTVLTALQFALEQGACVANLSFGWEDDKNQSYTFLDTALRNADAAGMNVVCAAGNLHQDVINCYPANSRFTIAVSSVNQSLNYEVYSNYGEKVDFCAPGSGIRATTVGGSVVNCSGTSFAAPHITAAIAELKILEPAATAARTYSLLRAYVNDLGVAGKDNIYGWGIPVLPDNYIERIVHTWDDGQITKDATSYEPGMCVHTCSVCGKTFAEELPATGETQFVDVPTTEYYAVPVAWAADQQITTGTDERHFSPDALCTRAQVVTFLWRAAGCPEPETTQSSFTDVPEGAYFRKAVLWAVENGITKGTTDTTFAPDATCTRAHVVTFLERYDRTRPDGGLPAPGGADTFWDVPDDAYYAEAVRWAVANGITNGMTPRLFGPDNGCTRAHVVTFLFRYLFRS